MTANEMRLAVLADYEKTMAKMQRDLNAMPDPKSPHFEIVENCLAVVKSLHKQLSDTPPLPEGLNVAVTVPEGFFLND